MFELALLTGVLVSLGFVFYFGVLVVHQLLMYMMDE